MYRELLRGSPEKQIAASARPAGKLSSPRGSGGNIEFTPGSDSFRFSGRLPMGLR